MNSKGFIKRFITVTLLVTVIISLIFGVKENFTKSLFLNNFIYSAAFAAGNLLFFFLIDKWLSWKKNPRRTLFISLAGVIPLNFVIFYLLNAAFAYFVDHESIEEALRIHSYFSYVFVVIFSMSIALFILMLYFFKMVSEEKVKNEKLKTETEKSKFNSLKSQLNPHFLFNNLNVLAALIHENPDKAEEFTLQLSDIYRYLLNTESKEMVPLEEEIDFAKKYMYLLNLRFENKLKYSFPQSLPPNKNLPPLSLQLLLENVIKHNKLSEEAPLNIDIIIKNDYLVVKNKIQKRKLAENTTQTGLYNLIKRYELLSDKPVIVAEEEGSFVVKIPLL